MSRSIGLIGVLLALTAGAWLYMKQTQAVSPAGTANPRATVDVVGVRNDLIAIANAERRHFANENKYVSLDELRSNGDISMPSNGRGPWSYSSETSDTGFRIVASYSGDSAAAGPKTISIDETMQITTE
jgi:hypothetical protein